MRLLRPVTLTCLFEGPVKELRPNPVRHGSCRPPWDKFSNLSNTFSYRLWQRTAGLTEAIGTQRDKAGNRNLFMDQYCTLILVWLFNPLMKSR